MQQIEKWGVFELALPGRSDGNPFVDLALTGTFAHGQEIASVDGFYDGDGVWRTARCA